MNKYRNLRTHRGGAAGKKCFQVPVIRFFRTWLVLLLLGLALQPASAHLPSFASGTATIEADGRFTLDLTFDVAAFAADQSPPNATDEAMRQFIDAPTNAIAARLAEAQARFVKDFAVLAGTSPGVVEKISFPNEADIERYKESVAIVQFPVMLVLSVEGRLPAGARSVSFRFPDKLDAIALTVMRPVQPPEALVVNPGEATPPVPLQLAAAPADPKPTAAAPEIAAPSRWKLAWGYLKLGFEHILPKGTDHILFVVGLFLLGNRMKPLLLQVTAFTVAHSITLGLALYGVFRLSPSVVEPLIAASIAFVAVENLCTSELKPWRPFVVFGFGLMHGMGFAGALMSLGVPRNAFATALVTFNGGVELGQLAVISLAFLAVGWWRRRTWYRRAIVIPASALIAAIGLFWTIDRLIHPVQ